MSKSGASRLPELLIQHEADAISKWTEEVLRTRTSRSELIRDTEVREQCAELLRLITQAVQNGNVADTKTKEWAPVRELLASISRTRVKQGFTASEVATFVFTLKRPLFLIAQSQYVGDAVSIAGISLEISELVDQLGLYATDAYQNSREEVIKRQQEELLELSTPVVKLWDGILALPIIGTLDSARTQVVMENLLQAIVDIGAEVAIIDITGVPTVDTLVSQHLLKTVAAARLMGADCIISGIRPQIAQTIVHLGVDLSTVITKSSLAEAFALALKRSGSSVTRQSNR